MKWSGLALIFTLVFFVAFVAFPKSQYSLGALFLGVYFVGVTIICLAIEDGSKT